MISEVFTRRGLWPRFIARATEAGLITGITAGCGAKTAQEEEPPFVEVDILTKFPRYFRSLGLTITTEGFLMRSEEPVRSYNTYALERDKDRKLQLVRRKESYTVYYLYTAADGNNSHITVIDSVENPTGLQKLDFPDEGILNQKLKIAGRVIGNKEDGYALRVSSVR